MKLTVLGAPKMQYGDQLDVVALLTEGSVRLAHEECLGGAVVVTSDGTSVNIRCEVCHHEARLHRERLVVGLRKMFVNGGDSKDGRYYEGLGPHIFTHELYTPKEEYFRNPNATGCAIVLGALGLAAGVGVGLA